MKTFTFVAKDGVNTSVLKEPRKSCKASQVLWGVLTGGGDLPSGLTLRFASSYHAHYLARKGKNALGFFDQSGLLVVNGIAGELVDAGVEGVIQPTSKPWKAIKVSSWEEKELKQLITTIRGILGFPQDAPKSKPQKRKTRKAKKLSKK